MTPKERLNNLKAELREIESKLEEHERLLARRRALIGGFGVIGEIYLAELDIRDSQFPVFKKIWNGYDRIVDVDNAYISLRADRKMAVRQYRINDGARKGSRKESLDKIDQALALSIWNAHKAGNNEPQEG